MRGCPLASLSMAASRRRIAGLSNVRASSASPLAAAILDSISVAWSRLNGVSSWVSKKP